MRVLTEPPACRRSEGLDAQPLGFNGPDTDRGAVDFGRRPDTLWVAHTRFHLPSDLECGLRAGRTSDPLGPLRSPVTIAGDLT